MPRPFDATTKHLIEHYPRDWLLFAGITPAGPVTVIDADLASIQAEADKVIRVDEPEPWIFHLELQSSYSADLPRRLVRYSVLLTARHGLPVRTLVVLLRPEADGPLMTGLHEQRLPDGDCYLQFRYNVVRLWEIPADRMLEGPLGTLPLALLTQASQSALPRMVERIDRRYRESTVPSEAAMLWTATYLLMGLRFDREFSSQLLKVVSNMRESATYQSILDEGRATEARALLLLLGERQFGPPSEAIRSVIEHTTDVGRLESLAERLFEVANWEELLANA